MEHLLGTGCSTSNILNFDSFNLVPAIVFNLQTAHPVKPKVFFKTKLINKKYPSHTQHTNALMHSAPYIYVCFHHIQLSISQTLSLLSCFQNQSVSIPKLIHQSHQNKRTCKSTPIYFQKTFCSTINPSCCFHIENVFLLHNQEDPLRSSAYHLHGFSCISSIWSSLQAIISAGRPSVAEASCTKPFHCIKS